MVLSDEAAAKELFVRRGNKYSDRGAPHAVEYISMNQNPGFRSKDGELSYSTLLPTTGQSKLVRTMVMIDRGMASPEEHDTKRRLHHVH